MLPTQIKHESLSNDTKQQHFNNPYGVFNHHNFPPVVISGAETDTYRLSSSAPHFINPTSSIKPEHDNVKNSNFNCYVCGFTTKDASQLQEHIRSSHNDFITAPLFGEHTQTSPSDSKKLYKCDLCDYSASDTFRIKRHRNSHSTEREYKCEICESSFKDKWALRSHEKIHKDTKPHKCTYCDYASVRSTTLKLHMRTHTGEKPYVCVYCGHCSAYQRHFKLHLMRVHFQVQPFKCDLCDYRTTEAFHLKRHITSVHISKQGDRCIDKVKEFRCVNCPFVTTRSSSLNRHLKIHTGDKPYVCVDCGHATAYKNHLALHRMRAHLGLKPHRCTLCDYSASASNQLKRHMLTHIKNQIVANAVEKKLDVETVDNTKIGSDICLNDLSNSKNKDL